jgi:alkylated DNA repair protein alkB family protein 7
LKENFVTKQEEEQIIGEVNHKFMRRKYNRGHWDGAIVSYREMEKLEWNPENTTIMKRFEKHVFGSEKNGLAATHVLDLHEDGYIKPHIDSVKFCGALVSGMSLLSDAVMRLQLDESNYIDVLIPRLSVYIMSNDIRYKYTHEILPNVASICGRNVNRKRRITIMKRSKESDHNSTS